MSRRASLPGAEELFRKTSDRSKAENRRSERVERQVNKSTNLQVAPAPAADTEASKAPKHDEKITFYCTGEDLMAIERTRLGLRAEHGVAADRGRIIRAALAYVLEDFEARADDSILLRQLDHD